MAFKPDYYPVSFPLDSQNQHLLSPVTAKEREMEVCSIADMLFQFLRLSMVFWFRVSSNVILSYPSYRGLQGTP